MPFPKDTTSEVLKKYSTNRLMQPCRIREPSR
jgi:hypothetical protein